MLVVTRYRGEGIRIGQNIYLKIIQVGEGRVAVGVEAPREIPVYRDEIPAIETELEDTRASSETRRVLVVEDTPIHATLIERALRKCGGFTTEVVHSAKEALQRLEAARAEPGMKPDLVLLDLRLPDRSGVDVLKWMRSDGGLRTTPVVMLSCSDSDTEVSRCLEMGANAFVSKAETYEGLRDSIYRIAQFWSSTCKVA